VFGAQQRPSRSEIERPQQQPRLNPVLRVLRRRLPKYVLTAPDAARIDGTPVASVVPMFVLPSGSVGRDPTDGADLDGAAPAHGVTAMAGSRMAGSARHSTTGTTTGGRLEPATCNPGINLNEIVRKS